MHYTKKLSVLFGLLGVLLLAGTVLLTLSFRSSAPKLPESMKHAEAQTRELMEAVITQDYAAAEGLMSGCPDLQDMGEPANPLSRQLWDMYGSSLSYKFDGPCYADDYGVYRDVTVTMADLTAIMTEVQSHAPILLANKATDHPDTAYNADGSYRQDFILQTLAEEAAGLQAEDYLTSRTLTLQLEGRGGQWVVRADRSLLDVLSGGMGGA